MLKLLLAISFLLILITQFSCKSHRHIYSPSYVSSPFLKEKGDGQISILYSGGDGNNGRGMREKNEGLDVLGSYAFSKNWAILANYYKRKDEDIYIDIPLDIFDSARVFYNRNLGGIAIGFFKPLTRNNNSTYNLYAGVNLGRLTWDDRGKLDSINSYKRFFKSNLVKIYIQQGFNFWHSDNFRIGLGLRFSLLHYSRITNNYTNPEQIYFHLNNLGNRIIFALEPSFYTEFGFRGFSWLKFTGGAGFIANWPYAQAATRSINGSVGLTFDIMGLKGKTAGN